MNILFLRNSFLLLSAVLWTSLPIKISLFFLQFLKFYPQTRQTCFSGNFSQLLSTIIKTIQSRRDSKAQVEISWGRKLSRAHPSFSSYSTSTFKVLLEQHSTSSARSEPSVFRNQSIKGEVAFQFRWFLQTQERVLWKAPHWIKKSFSRVRPFLPSASRLIT